MKTHLTLRIYRDKKKDLRWTLIASNGRAVANGGEGYRRRIDMAKAIFLTFLGSGFPPGKDPVLTVMNFRADFKLEDNTNKGRHYGNQRQKTS